MGANVIAAAENMILPLTMLGSGIFILLGHPPYNAFFGYHTSASHKSPQAWVRAQYLFGFICTVSFAVLSILTLFAGIIQVVFKFDKNTVGIITTSAIILSVAAIFAAIAITEISLAREFDKHGDPKGDSRE